MLYVNADFCSYQEPRIWHYRQPRLLMTLVGASIVEWAKFQYVGLNRNVTFICDFSIAERNKTTVVASHSRDHTGILSLERNFDSCTWRINQKR
jgi:hypothetical protein